MIHTPIASATTLLIRALTRSAADAGVDLTVTQANERPWASVTFSGARHRLLIEGPAGNAFDGWLAQLGEAELTMRGHIVLEPEIAWVTSDQEVRRAGLEVISLIDG